jgi:methylated-DNA-[protein]-cysteine S-methyltransferase
MQHDAGMTWTVVVTPIGGLGLRIEGDALSGVSFGADASQVETGADPPVGVLADAVRELEEYFAGERTGFSVPAQPRRGSPFERAVWAEIAAIAYGETMSYGAIARAVGEPGGAQAVGLACNRNPLPVIVPCHRVIGSDGKLVGFGGGLDRKRWLLRLEARIAIERSFAGEPI